MIMLFSFAVAFFVGWYARRAWALWHPVIKRERRIGTWTVPEARLGFSWLLAFVYWLGRTIYLFTP